jgi:hypothetical protein
MSLTRRSATPACCANAGQRATNARTLTIPEFWREALGS